LDEIDEVSHCGAIIFYHTGIDPDTLTDDEFIKAYSRVDYTMRKLYKK